MSQCPLNFGANERSHAGTAHFTASKSSNTNRRVYQVEVAQHPIYLAEHEPSGQQ